jgi:hypothetical protein
MAAKAAAKQGKEAERERKADEKRLAKGDKRKSREVPRASDAIVAAEATTITVNAPISTEEVEAVAVDDEDLYRDQTPGGQAPSEPEPLSQPMSPTSPTSPTSARTESKGLKGLLSKLKRRSKHEPSAMTPSEPGFVGGASLNHASTSLESSPLDPEPTHLPDTEHHYSDVSSISSGDSEGERGRAAVRTPTRATDTSVLSGGTEFEEARDDFDEHLAPPPTFTSDTASKGSPTRDSRFREVGI